MANAVVARTRLPSRGEGRMLPHRAPLDRGTQLHLNLPLVECRPEGPWSPGALRGRTDEADMSRRAFRVVMASAAIAWVLGCSRTPAEPSTPVVLQHLSLGANSVSDISALEGLTNLESLFLATNPGLGDIQPLLDNTGLGGGDSVDLRFTNVDCADADALSAKGVTVTIDCGPVLLTPGGSRPAHRVSPNSASVVLLPHRESARRASE
jgi:hypothetical protein